MNKIIKDELYKQKYNEISDILSKLDDDFNYDYSLSILADILKDYDLSTASNMVRHNCDPNIAKNCLDYFDEGNEDSGFINLSSIISDYEEILNCDDSNGDVKIRHAIRLETDEEKEENGHNNDVEWFTKDESINIKKIILEFEG